MSKFSSPLRYSGGKTRALKQIDQMLPISCLEYRELMVGGGSVYFHLRNRGFAEKWWINDAFPELIAFWRCAKEERIVSDMVNRLMAIKSRAEVRKTFYESRDALLNDDPSVLDAAIMFYLLNRCSFSGTTLSGGYSADAAANRFTVARIQSLATMPKALAGTILSCHDYELLLTTEGDDVFCFVDPPYFTKEDSKLYGRNGHLSNFDHERLAKALHETNHKFLLTYDDCPEIRGMYKWANIYDFKLQYGMSNCNRENKSKIGDELFITNYEVVPF